MKNKLITYLGDDTMQKITLFLKHTKMLVRPIIFGAIVSLIWYLFSFLDIHFQKTNDEVIGAITAGLLFVWGFFATKAYDRVEKGYDKIMDILEEEDTTENRKRFRKCYKRNVPDVFHFLMQVTTFVVLIFLALIDYRHTFDGVVLMFSITFIIVLVYEIVIDLDQPKAVWYQSKKLHEWIEDLEKTENRVYKITAKT